MILFAKKEDKEQIIKLWNEAFGDSEEYIKKALKVFLDYMILYKIDNEVCAMLTALPVSLGEKRGRYIYGVATFSKYQNKGIAGELLEYVKQYIDRGDEDFCVLVPAGESLFGYYKKHGFETVRCIDRVSQIHGKNIVPVRISASEYFIRRKKYVDNLIEWSEQMLEKIRKLYNGEFYGTDNAVFFCVKDGGNLYIKELLGDKSELGRLSGDYKTVNAVTIGNEPFAMVYPKEYKNCYFNIAID